MGDAILAFFGAPTAHEDDPERAVLAGLAIVEGIRAYRVENCRKPGLAFDVRVGINTGLAVVGEVGSTARAEYTAMGDAVNLAARMEQTAQPGTVQISAHTFEYVASLFECEPLGNLSIKGKAEPVAAFRVIARHEQPVSSRAMSRPHHGALVARHDEIKLLRDALEATHLGHGRVIVLAGEPGLGKSRLIAEAHGIWDKLSEPSSAGSPVHWSASRATSYDSLQSYGQFMQHLRNILAVSADDPAEIVRREIERVLADTPVDRRARLKRALAAVLAVERAEDPAPLEGDTRIDLLDALSYVVRGWAATAPGVLVFDDLHWADPASIDLLGHLLAFVEEVPVTFLCAFRPDPHAPSWRLRERANVVVPERVIDIALQPLDARDCAALLRQILDAEDVPERLRELAVAKSDGNPLFLQELIRSLSDRGALARDRTSRAVRLVGDVPAATVPDNVRGLLVSRIDRLPFGARQALEIASVIGRSFGYTTLRGLTTALDLDEQLAALERSGLIAEVAAGTEREFTFTHALTRDAAYESILLKRRRVLHREVGDLLERAFAEKSDDHAAFLAYHFAEAGDNRAAYYYLVAGGSAYRLDAHVEAAEHYRRALALATRSPADLEELGDRTGRSRIDLLLHLHLRLGRALQLGGRNADAITTYQSLRSLIQDDASALLAAMTAEATIYATPNPQFNPAKGRDLLDDCLTRARLLGDRAVECRILWNLLLLHTYTFDVERAIEVGEVTLALARELGEGELLAFVTNDLHRPYLFASRLDRAGALLAEALALWRTLDNRPMLVDSLASKACLDYLTGHYDQAIDAAEEASQLAQAMDNDWGRAHGQAFVGQIFFERGHPDRAIVTMEDAIRMGVRSGYPIAITGTRAQLGYALGVLGQIDRGMEICRQGITASDGPFAILRCWPLAALARLQLLAGQISDAEQTVRTARAELTFVGTLCAPVWVVLADGELALARHEFDRAAAVASELQSYLRDFQTRAGLADAYLLAGRAALGQGYLDSARKHLTQARAEAEATGASTILSAVQDRLTEVEERASKH
jgi:tetratricopeptide (TPR) repeat protein